jgi:nucleoside-diphosphate-sugar epimerase
MFVSDTVAGVLALGECEQALGRVVNLGTGRSWSIEEVAQFCFRVVGREVPIESQPERIRPIASEVLRLQSDPRLARDLCGWKAKVGLEEGLTETSAYVRSNPQRYLPEEYQT